MKILVTGATGFVGGHLVGRLKESGHVVRVMVRQDVQRLFKFSWLNNDNVDIVKGDVTNPEDVEKAVQGVDTVFHLAALLGKWGVPEREYYRVNVYGTRTLVKECLKTDVGHLIFLSSTGVIGRLKKIPGDLDHPCHPVSAYEKSKYQAELEVKQAIHKRNFPATIVRSTHIYGPGDSITFKFFKMIKSTKVFPLIGGGRYLFQPIYIKDLVDALYLCMEKHSVTTKKSYIVAGNEKTTFKKFIELSAEIMGTNMLTVDIPERLAWVMSNVFEGVNNALNQELPLTSSRVEFFTRHHVYDIQRICEDTGFTPKVDLKTGIEKTIKWGQENGWL